MKTACAEPAIMPSAAATAADATLVLNFIA
jgi:hypothetical protein